MQILVSQGCNETKVMYLASSVGRGGGERVENHQRHNRQITGRRLLLGGAQPRPIRIISKDVMHDAQGKSTNSSQFSLVLLNECWVDFNLRRSECWCSHELERVVARIKMS